MSDGRSETPRDIVPGFAQLVRARREKFEWSRHELARQAQVGMTTVCDVENERRSPSLRVAQRLAQALKIRSFLTDPAKPVKLKKRAKRPLSDDKSDKQTSA